MLYGTVKKMILVICVSSLIIIAAGAVYYRSFLVFPFAFGVLLMSALNVLKVMMLKLAFEKAFNAEAGAAGNFIRFQHWIGYLLTGLILLLAVKTPFISLLGAAVGVFTLKISAFIVGFFERGEKTDVKYA